MRQHRVLPRRDVEEETIPKEDVMNNYRIDLESDIVCPGCDGRMVIRETYNREAGEYVITEQRCTECGYSI